jgi:hypothetical protein
VLREARLTKVMTEFIKSNNPDDISPIEEKQPTTASTHKEPYEKPAYRYEKVFVTTALSCGKMVGTGSCPGMTKSS